MRGPIFDTFLSRNIPHEGEALFTFVDGQAFRASAGAPHALDREPDLVERWGSLTEAEGGSVDTPAGPARYLAVPIRQDGETLGVFVVTNFVQAERQEINDAIRLGAFVSAGVLLVAAAAAWVTAGRVLAPVRVLTENARSITETDLSRRIPVTGDDEIAELTETFNSMLDRLDAAFATQRTFTDDAAHELRTPITIIRGHLELLGDDPDERAEVVEIVTDELDRMSRLVDDMLLLAKASGPDSSTVSRCTSPRSRPTGCSEHRALGDREWHARRGRRRRRARRPPAADPGGDEPGRERSSAHRPKVTSSPSAPQP